jgi:hypothetical protein
MLRKDYIIRQLDEFGKVMALILNYKKLQDWDKFENEINATSIKFTSIEINKLEKFNEADFKKEILNNTTLTQDQLKILADLLFEKLNFYAQKNDTMSYNNLKVNCVLLYKHIQNQLTQNEFDLNVYYKLEILNKKD